MTQFVFQAGLYPAKPGCYLMKDREGKVIYVGKAKDLRRRLSSYFQRRLYDGRTQQLVATVDDIEVILVNNEVEGLVLENNLIKKHSPRYNRRLIEEESGYYYIALTGENPARFIPYRKSRTYKSLGPVRRIPVARWFGPYVRKRVRDNLLDLVSEYFRVRTCSHMPRRVCLRYHLGRCDGVCEQLVSREAYARIIAHAVDFLSHQHADLVQQLTEQMREHADRLEFEAARRMRDRIEALDEGLERQIVERCVEHDQDVVYFRDDRALITQVRAGAIQSLKLRDVDMSMGHPASCDHFLLSRYATGSPRELIVNHVRDPGGVQRVLASSNHQRVKVTVPQGGVKYELLEFCERNLAYRVSNGG